MEIEDNYIVLNEHRLILERVEGILSLQNLGYIKNLQDQDNDFNPTFNLLSDIKNTRIEFTSEELDIYANLLENHPVSTAGRKFALITDTPKQVAIATLIKNKTSSSNQEIEIFSSLEAALEWLNSNLEFNEAFQIFENKLPKSEKKYSN